MGVYEGRFAFDVYNDKKEKISSMEEIIELLKPKRVEVIALIKPEVTFSGGTNYGFGFRVYQIVVFPVERRAGLLIDLDDGDKEPVRSSHDVDDSDNEDGDNKVEPEHSETHEEGGARVNDEEIDDLDVSPEEVPPVKTEKKVISKKKGKLGE